MPDKIALRELKNKSCRFLSYMRTKALFKDKLFLKDTIKMLSDHCSSLYIFTQHDFLLIKF